jgi:hypothetical protein
VVGLFNGKKSNFVAWNEQCKNNIKLKDRIRNQTTRMELEIIPLT